MRSTFWATWLLTLLCAGMGSALADGDRFNLRISAAGATTDKGHLIFALYSSADDWLKKPVDKLVIRVQEGQPVVADFGIRDAGEYGVALLYDVNDNGKLDTRRFKIPKEEFGFSNNPKIMFGPPKWKDAVFSLNDGDLEIEVKMVKIGPNDFK